MFNFFFIEPPCTRALDLGIIIDKSKSVKIANLRKLKRSLEKFVHKFEVSAEGTHVGLISFNDNAELLFDFKDDRYHTEDQLRKAIKKIPLKLEYQTRTDLALTLAKEKLFSDKGGDRPNVPNALIIFTDGKSTGKRKHKGFVPIPETVKILTEVGKHPSLHPSTSPSFRPPSIHPSLRPSIHHCVRLSVRLSIHPPSETSIPHTNPPGPATVSNERFASLPV